MVELSDPWFLLLLPLPLLAYHLLPPHRQFGAVLSVPDQIGRNILAGAGQGGAQIAQRWLLSGAIWLLLILALAGPRQLIPVPALKVSGRDLAIAIDLSGSMVRDDFYLDDAQVTRLQAVQTIGAEFVRRRAGDRVALIIFGSDAYYAAPFSFDTEAIARRIEESTIGISGRATNISDALGLALKRLKNSQAAARVVILLSDGVNNAGATNPRGVAKLASDMGVRIHTIAFGPKDLASSTPGERGVVDAATLKAVSDLSGGTSFRVRTSEDLQEVTRALDKLEATDSDGLAAEIYRELWVWPAAMAAGLCLFLAWRREA
ncbi:VWA domain-containing protein [uncultured Roseovarius sp.]|uniref:VWA domain-containing protein n=1 Tax=uncultured Roseovarius sp. TaxID=293344 RepID=UPI0026059EFD|nr:VWA domain-containing protein [uncultured Roseovarius sp.]